MTDITSANEQQGIDLLLRGVDIFSVPFDKQCAQQFNKYCAELEIDQLVTEVNWSKDFNIPDRYKQIDVEEYVKDLIPQTEDQTLQLAYLKRVELELDMYKTRNMYSVIQLMIYIVDTMRKHNLVWGVGRGSAVSSYLLYLIGVHKVDSIKYNLDIKEFLK